MLVRGEILQFFPEKIEQVEAEFNGKKSMRFRYTVIEEGSSNQEKYLEVGKRTSEEIDSFLIEETYRSIEKKFEISWIS